MCTTRPTSKLSRLVSGQFHVPRDWRDGLDVTFRLGVRQEVAEEFGPFFLGYSIEKLPLLAGLLPLAELLLLRHVQRLDRVLDELGAAHAELIRVVVALHELDEEPFVIEELSGEGLEQRPERIIVLVYRRQELGALRFQVR